MRKYLTVLSMILFTLTVGIYTRERATGNMVKAFYMGCIEASLKANREFSASHKIILERFCEARLNHLINEFNLE